MFKDRRRDEHLNYPPGFLASLKLPSYEEVAAQPSTPPPPYSSVFTAPRYPQPPRASDPHLLTRHDPLLHQPLSDGPSSLSSDNRYWERKEVLMASLGVLCTSTTALTMITTLRPFKVTPVYTTTRYY